MTAKSMGKTENKMLRMPITNVYAKGGFSAAVSFGSRQDTVQLMLDTGSSTLVVTQHAYDSLQDASLQPTMFAQCVQYGLGGWYGPVVKTEVDMLAHGEGMCLKDTHVSIATVLKEGCFANSDGILGLAYHRLNDAHSLESYLTEKEISPKVTWPWSSTKIETETITEFNDFLEKQPMEVIEPYFTQLEEEGITANKFSFVTRRSSIHHASPDLSVEQLKIDPLNQGLFILGGGEENTDLYQGEFKRIRVIDDVYYNVNLLKVKVGDAEPIEVPKLVGTDLKHYHSNAFVDTGASLIALESSVFDGIIQCFEQINPDFKKILEPFLTFEFKEEGIPLEDLNLADWPDIEFIFESSVSSAESETSILCKASDYWQVNAPSYGQASFKIMSQVPGWPDQSILGLPLISDYYVVFSRFENEFGDIKFAQIKN